MIDRYIYAVTKELPDKSRKEITNELSALISDMMEGLDGDRTEVEKIDIVLRELGDPRELANRYRGEARYLIGPKYFDQYILVIKVVTLSIFIGISIASGLGAVFSIQGFRDAIGSYLSSMFSAVLQGAAWVTVIFALLEYNDISVETKREQGDWEPSQLPMLPKEKARISRGESIFSIILNTIFLQLFFFSPEMIGVYFQGSDRDLGFIRLFQIEAITAFKVIVFVVFTINILIELIKIIKGRWSLKTAVIISILNVISSGLSICVISNVKIWNPEMILTVEQYLPISFNRMIVGVIAVIIIITIFESASALYKGFKYGRDDFL